MTSRGTAASPANHLTVTAGPLTSENGRRPSLRPLALVLALLVAVWLGALVLILAQIL